MNKQTQAQSNPFPYSDSNKRYHTFDYYLRRTYGKKCAKVPLDGGFSCPNIDGTISLGGCTFCSARGSGDFCAEAKLNIREQYDALRSRTANKWGDTACIPYFQAFSNTYAPPEELRAKYAAAAALPGAVCLCIATRPDCLSEAVLDCLTQTGKSIDLVVELGLQSIHDQTLDRINRGHDYDTFLKGFAALRKRKIPICVHLINGLPGEDEDMMLATGREMARLRPDFLKIHSLYLLKGTEMAKQYSEGDFSLLSLREYTEITCRQLEYLPPQTVIARIMGDGNVSDLIAPEWCRKKCVVQNEIDKWLYAHRSMQGIRYQDSLGNAIKTGEKRQ